MSSKREKQAAQLRRLSRLSLSELKALGDREFRAAPHAPTLGRALAKLRAPCDICGDLATAREATCWGCGEPGEMG